ncbi:acetolactate synthase small subunit, partial [Akkermansia muciniphila]|nr:acetolactate synthase small subunit [Akkermansia muciniphila]
IGVDSATRNEVIDVCQILGSHIVDVTRDALTIEVTGGEYKIDRFLSLIEDYDVQMLTRRGRIALPKPCQLKNHPV